MNQTGVPERQVPPTKARDAYIATSRVRAAEVVARISALLLLAGFIGSLGTWGKRNSVFELASNSIETARPGAGYIAGPLLIALILPFIRRRPLAKTGESPWFAYRRIYRARVAIVALLFLAGLVALAVDLVGLESSYTIKTGAYVAGVLLAVGLVATVAMWPAGLPTVRMHKGGQIQSPATEGEMAGNAEPTDGRAASRAPESSVAKAPSESALAAAPGAAASGAPPPGWYPNPGGPGKRFWDGSHWTERCSPAPDQSAHRGKARRATYVVAGLAVAALLVVAGIVVVNDQNQSNRAAHRADMAYRRLTAAIDRSEQRTDVAIHKTFGRLARVSTAHPYGGPELAQCTPLCERSTETARRAMRRLDAAYRSSPGYLRRIYGPAIRSTKRVLAAAALYTDALAEWTRVHGASEYAGAAEFDQAEVQKEHLEGTNRRNQKSLKRARRHWHRYAARRWDLQYR